VRVAIALTVAALTPAGYSGAQSAGSSFKPVKPGVLTVATAFLPAPAFWEGSPPTSGRAQLAAALAHRLGLERVEVVQVPFTAIIKGDLGGADLALSQLTPTAKREHSLDFTTAYLTAPPGVLALRSVEASDALGLRELHWVASRARRSRRS
jgi:polar amino acid transport system substrate-binding protein